MLKTIAENIPKLKEAEPPKEDVKKTKRRKKKKKNINKFYFRLLKEYFNHKIKLNYISLILN